MSCLYLTGKCRLAVLSALLVSSATYAFAQTMTPPPGATPSKDSISDPVKPSMEPAHGLVARADGSVPEDLIEIHLICGGAAKLIAIPDSKGRFDIVLAELKDIPDPEMCVLRAFLDGYHSETKPLAKVNLTAGAKLGRIVLQPLSSDSTGVASSTSAQVSKAGKKAYEQGLDDAARQYWKNALKSFQKAVSSEAIRQSLPPARVTAAAPAVRVAPPSHPVTPQVHTTPPAPPAKAPATQANRPPAVTPPAHRPPAVTPPARPAPETTPRPESRPPAVTPPANRPPAEKPAARSAPETTPRPESRPPAATPPANRPPAEKPPARPAPETTPRPESRPPAATPPPNRPPAENAPRSE